MRVSRKPTVALFTEHVQSFTTCRYFTYGVPKTIFLGTSPSSDPQASLTNLDFCHYGANKAWVTQPFMSYARSARFPPFHPVRHARAGHPHVCTDACSGHNMILEFPVPACERVPEARTTFLFCECIIPHPGTSWYACVLPA